MKFQILTPCLRSQLDQYQSVFKVGDGGTSGSPSSGSGPVKKSRKTARGVGISAEPQSLKSLQDLTQKTFPSYKKSDKAQELIRGAIMDNDFLKNLETSQIKVRKSASRTNIKESAMKTITQTNCN